MNFNILGIGLPQLIIVFGLAMILFGPKKMIQYAYQAGRWISQLRVMWEEAAKNVQKEFHEAGLDLPADLPIRGGRIDIGAAAMRIVEQVSAPPAPVTTSDTTVTAADETPFTTLAESSLLSAPSSSLTTSGGLPPSLSYPTETGSPSSVAPEVSTQANTQTEQGKKYDAWLPD